MSGGNKRPLMGGLRVKTSKRRALRVLACWHESKDCADHHECFLTAGWSACVGLSAQLQGRKAQLVSADGCAPLCRWCAHRAPTVIITEGR